MCSTIDIACSCSDSKFRPESSAPGGGVRSALSPFPFSPRLDLVRCTYYDGMSYPDGNLKVGSTGMDQCRARAERTPLQTGKQRGLIVGSRATATVTVTPNKSRRSSSKLQAGHLGDGRFEGRNHLDHGG